MLEGGAENGDERDGDDENEYLQWQAPKLIGKGDGGVGGDDDMGET